QMPDHAIGGISHVIYFLTVNRRGRKTGDAGRRGPNGLRLIGVNPHRVVATRRGRIRTDIGFQRRWSGWPLRTGGHGGDQASVKTNLIEKYVGITSRSKLHYASSKDINNSNGPVHFKSK